MMTSEVREYHDIYESKPQDFQEAIDEAYDAAVEMLRHRGLAVNNTDIAEEFIAAITKYTLEAEKDNREWNNEAKLS